MDQTTSKNYYLIKNLEILIIEEVFSFCIYFKSVWNLLNISSILFALNIYFINLHIKIKIDEELSELL